MRRSLFSAPEDFTLFPLLVLLPNCGELHDIKRLTSALFARLERVRGRKLGLQAGGSLETKNKLVVEELMLTKVLEWLAVKTDQQVGSWGGKD